MYRTNFLIVIKGEHPINYLFSFIKYLNHRRKMNFSEFKRFMTMQKIMEHNELKTYFQPLIDLSSGQNIGFEALNRPPLSNVFPSTEHFYDFLGQTDQVFFFECICRNLSLSRFIEKQKDLKVEDNLLLFINLHPKVLLDSNYKSGETLQLLKEIGISPNQIVFELTEKNAVSDFEEFEMILSHYRSQGFRMAIDDAGSGYNSLKTLIYLKPEFIKLDRSLIYDIYKNEEQQYLVTLIMDFATKSNTYVIAEGIEKIEDLDYLQRQGVHFGQGYALGMPNEQLKLGMLPKTSVSKQLSFL